MNVSLIAAIAIYVLEAVVLIVSTYIGYRKKIGNGLIRLAVLVILSVMAYFVAFLVAPKISDSLMPMLDKINIEMVKSILVDSPETVALLKVILSTYLSAVIFPVFFIIFEFIFSVVFAFVSKKISNKVEFNVKPWVNHTVGAAIGLVNGFIIISICMIPLTLVSVSLEDTYNYKSDNINETVNDNYVSVFNPSSMILHQIATVHTKSLPEEYVDIFGHDVDMASETKWLIGAARHAADSYNNAIQHDMSSKEAVFCAVGAANEWSGQSEVIPDIFTRIVLVASDRWSHDQAFIGIELHSDNKLAASMISNILDTLHHTTTSNVHSTIKTFFGSGYDKGVINSMLELTALQAEDNATSSDEYLTNVSDILSDTLVAFGQNDDFKDVTDSVSNDIRDEFIGETKEKIFPESISSQEKKEIATKLTEEINTYNELLVDDTNEYDYETYIDNVSEHIITEASEKYNYDVTKSEAEIVAVSLTSYLETTDNASVEGVLSYFGFSDTEINEIINSVGQ